MTNQNKKLIAGFITYGDSTAKYLPYFLDSLNKQTFKDLDILVCDNTPQEDNSNLTYLSKFPLIEVVARGENLGFAKGYNILIKKALEKGAVYFLALNPDMLLEPDAIERLVKALDNDKNLGSASPKILKWDFEKNQKTSIIDTCGIKLDRGLIFSDLGQAQEDQGQCDDQEIIGPSGAAAIYSLEALESVKEKNDNYFDELMFMYKEDCDLAYRLYLAGFKSVCVKNSIFYHDRTASGKGKNSLRIALNRKNKNKKIKEWSFFNQQIIFIKYWHRQNFFNKLAVLWYQFRVFCFILLLEQYLFKKWWQVFKLRKSIKKY